MSKLEKNSKILTSFDYTALDAEQRTVVVQRTGEIRDRLRRSAQDIWEIGQKLADVRSRLKHGQFEAWLKAEFDWSRRTAYNFINVYETFGKRANLAQIDIATSVLYLLAAPSTPPDVRDKLLQQAREGETVTHKNLRQLIESKKSQSSNLVESEPPTAFASKPEVETPVIERQPSDSTSLTIATPSEIAPGWYLLAKQHLLFCGDTASAQFVECIPQAALAIAITSDDWDHDWLVERAKTVIIFPESELKAQLSEQLIEMFSLPGEVVIFPWLPDSNSVAIAHKLGRRLFAGDPQQQRCSQAIARSGLTSERLNL